jgi:CubicO group peptidase (beta-lactamase class C family)
VEYAAGAAVTGPAGSLPAGKDTIYDCASLTKVIVTLPLVLMLIDQGSVCLDDPVRLWLPQFAESGKSAVTVRQLLTHTAGFPPHSNLHSHGWTKEQVLERALETQPVYEPGSRVIYSDLGYIALGCLVSALFGEPLDRAAGRRLFGPLGMNASCYCPPARLRPRIAATEHYPDEAGPRWGTVHDENALAMGGVSGHAGLFSTAADLTRYASMWLGGGRLDGKRLLSQSAVDLALRNHTASIEGGERGLGWVLKGDPFDASGDLLSAASYGHTGFTGTSLYIDPMLGLSVVLLTNRVHFGRDKSVVRLRAAFHNAVAGAVAD